MNVTPTHARPGELFAPAPPTARGPAFSADFDVDAQRDVSEARRQAEKLTASALIAPVLAQLRENSTAAPPFGPTMAEKRFGPIQDAIVADRLVQASNFPIVDAIARRFGDPDAGPPPGSQLELTA